MPLVGPSRRAAKYELAEPVVPMSSHDDQSGIVGPRRGHFYEALEHASGRQRVRDGFSARFTAVRHAPQATSTMDNLG